MIITKENEQIDFQNLGGGTYLMTVTAKIADGTQKTVCIYLDNKAAKAVRLALKSQWT